VSFSGREEQLIIRFPPDVTARLDSSLDSPDFANFHITFVDSNHATVTLFGETFAAVLLPLPTSVETYRTPDASHLHKSGDIDHVLIVHRADASTTSRVRRRTSRGGAAPVVRRPRKRKKGCNLEIARLELEPYALPNAEAAANPYLKDKLQAREDGKRRRIEDLKHRLSPYNLQRKCGTRTFHQI
jgi:transcription initiation factor TFIID subunit 7